MRWYRTEISIGEKTYVQYVNLVNEAATKTFLSFQYGRTIAKTAKIELMECQPERHHVTVVTVTGKKVAMHGDYLNKEHAWTIALKRFKKANVRNVISWKTKR